MRWGKRKAVYGNPKWHGIEGDSTVCGEWVITERSWVSWEMLPEDRRPALARNNVCMKCKKLYLVTRPDLQGYFDRLNDKRDV